MQLVRARETVELECYTDSDVISGSVRCPAELRLTDVLNSSEQDSRSEFVHFVDPLDAGESRVDGRARDVYVRKSAVQFAATPDGDVRRGVATDHGYGHYPFALKSPVQVSLRLPSYTLIGRIHRRQGQTIEGVLNEGGRFLPMTEVTIIRENRVYGSRPFVAVNRQHIVWSTQDTHSDGTSG